MIRAFLAGFVIGVAWAALRRVQPARPFRYTDPQSWGVTQNGDTGNFTFGPKHPLQ